MWLELALLPVLLVIFTLAVSELPCFVGCMPKTKKDNFSSE
ncbi:uncharacterized protein METZ01_LOCUS165286 [marine metagenome]|uniref:Uncharacterized protein n=1 Tax=marine metagenome TaxID=408172 RepID=A0A382BGN9_9ZZZZ